jgi:hypothetical protein
VRTDAPSADTYPGSVVSTPAAATTPAAAGASTGAFADISDDDVPF